MLENTKLAGRIERCQKQIAMTFETEYIHEHPQDFIVVRQGFQKQLKRLLDEKEKAEMQAFRSRAEAAINNTIQELQGKAA